MADEIKTERVSITIRGKKGRRRANAVQTKGPRYGPFTRPVDDDPIIVNPPVLLASAFDTEFFTAAYDLTSPASPKSPKRVSVPAFRLVARNRTVAFPSAQGYAFTFDGADFKLEALNLSKPRKPVSTSSFITATFRQPVIDEGLLYWCEPGVTPSINVADASNPAAIALIHTYDSVADFTAKQRYMGTPSALNGRLYIVSAPNFFTAGGDGAAAYLATYNFDNPEAATQINVITFDDGENNVPQLPSSVLGDGVVYTAYMNRNVDFSHTTRIRTYSIADPDAPVEVNSLAVATDPTPVFGFDVPGYAPKQLFINKAKTRLFLQTHPSPPVVDLIGALWMFDISTPTAPALLDSIPLAVGDFDSELRMYAADTGYAYVGNPITGLCAIYKYSDGVFDLVNTLAVAAEPLVALDNKGFPL